MQLSKVGGQHSPPQQEGHHSNRATYNPLPSTLRDHEGRMNTTQCCGQIQKQKVHFQFFFYSNGQDEECLRPGEVSDMTFLDKMEKTIGEHAHFIRQLVTVFV